MTQELLAYASIPFYAIINSFFYNIYVADFIDILIIGILLYTAFILFKNTKSFFILAGIMMFAALYIIAILFNLYLTSVVLQGFFGAFLVILVILFQEELRRFFEFTATRWKDPFKRKKMPVIVDDGLKQIIQAVSNLAHQKIGALIIFEGNEILDRYLESDGVKLDGKISESLLESLFDPSSPGHDGAVIISKGKVSAFSVHLPLSSNIREIGKYGTRHTAALGISEKSDALAISVSEEKGTVSVALDGKLKTLQDIFQLENILNKFFKEKFPRTQNGFIENWLKRNSKEKIAAFVIAAGLWFFLVYQTETVQRIFVVPVEYRNLPVDLVIEEVKPTEINLTLSGRSQSFNLFDQKMLGVSIDASKIDKTGTQTVLITENLIRRPQNIKVLDVSPDKIQFTARKVVEKTLLIIPKTEGNAAPGFFIENIKASPSSLPFLVPENLAGQIENIPTESINIAGIDKTASFTAQLNLPPNIRLINEEKPPVIQISVTIKKF